jgi:hypothetical protein
MMEAGTVSSLLGSMVKPVVPAAGANATLTLAVVAANAKQHDETMPNVDYISGVEFVMSVLEGEYITDLRLMQWPLSGYNYDEI